MNREYKILKRQEYRLGDYKIVPIREQDKYKIMQWRNEQMYHLRQQKPLTKQEQDNYFNTVINKLFEQKFPKQILFSFLYKNQCIGYGGPVHIDWQNKSAEISFLMQTELEKNDFEKNWSVFLNLIEKVAFNELKLHKIYTYAYDLRPHLYPVLENAGFVLARRLKNAYEIDNQNIDIVIHEKINPADKITFRKVKASDINLLFNWANDEEVRKQSFSTGKIDFETHKIWFQNKLKNKNSIMYIAEIDNTPFSLIRFDKENDHAVIGILLDKNWRGKSLSVPVLKKATELFQQKNPLPVYAYIKETNTPSIKAFKHAGYIFHKKQKLKNSVIHWYIKKTPNNNDNNN